jgi:uncharacterized protein (UPF0147 family)
MAKGLSVEVKANELDVVKDIFQFLQDITYDERIPTNVREEIIDKANEIMERER